MSADILEFKPKTHPIREMILLEEARIRRDDGPLMIVFSHQKEDLESLAEVLEINCEYTHKNLGNSENVQALLLSYSRIVARLRVSIHR
ncbi:MAG: hypothetical protein JAZ17_09535 [Candidatus Thiodiazotropha endolucinida]|nr:hypothetical protein [Candidatus Thiodiazotropha endolucinida]